MWQLSPKYSLRILDMNWIQISDKPANCCGKPSGVFAVRNRTLLDSSTTMTLPFSAMRMTSLADGKIISNIFETNNYHTIGHSKCAIRCGNAITVADVFLADKAQ